MAMASLVPALVVHGALSATEAQSVPPEVLGTSREASWLLEHTKVNGTVLAKQLAEHEHLEYVSLADQAIDPEAVKLVPAHVCRRDEVLPIGFGPDGSLRLAMLDPSNVLAIDDAQLSSGRMVTPVIVADADLSAAINKYHRSDKELSDLTTAISEEIQQRQLDLTQTADEDDDSAPIVRLVNLLISQAIHDHASDIHIDPGEKESVVRYRVDGVLREVQRASSEIHSGLVSRLKIMAGMDIAEKRVPQDGRFTASTGERRVDLRVATLPTVWGETVVMRLLDAKAAPQRLDDLGFEPDQLQQFRSAIHSPHGLVLATGPTGSGKSTTLYAALRDVASDAVNVITVEDPVEFRYAGINQIQVNPRAGLTFARVLRAILRADPDIVLIGEIRDEETARIAIEASLTGHLVLATLHTNDAASAITRLSEMGVEPYLITSALSAVVGQRLARQLCPTCRREHVIPVTQAQKLGLAGPAAADDVVVYEPVGCSQCQHTGYKSRVGLREVMRMTPELARLALHGAQSDEIAAAAVQQGTVLMRDDGWQKVREGRTTIEEVLRVVA
ncbi:GspE/PulE family protein [Pseudoclavibacter sp. 13-3]|uniref:GspE/PulE family protein n=1 Tax=Pseudoclavibacter sp. 13-3 TaxID=2901228 RepID=UPI001E3E1D01|nr:GspE/PulE family protein [Pseudoclavibacter sp. 13-3]MCD7101598.1 GspE/PulE family protein [Pseudoclavibacter sp. 13-3]